MGTEEKYRRPETDGHTHGPGRTDVEAHAGHSMDADHEDKAHAHTHTHTHAHTHTHTHKYTHSHTHKNTKAVLDRLARAIGHPEKVRLMVEDGEDCSAVPAVCSKISNQ